MTKRKILVTGAAGYVSGRMLPELRERYDLVLLDASPTWSPGRPHAVGTPVEDVQVADLLDPDRSKYQHLFEGVDAVVHLAYIRQREDASVDRYPSQRENVDMAYNVLRAAYDAGVRRVVSASSNHAADWYETAMLHDRKMEVLDPYDLALSDNFYGWSKATYEHLGFLFACGSLGRKMDVVMVRIGSPGEVKPNDDPRNYKRNLGTYLSQRDQTQLFVKSIEVPNIENEHGIPWLVIYGISNNTRGFWSLSNAREIIGYEPEDDAEVKFANDIEGFLTGGGAKAGPGRLGR